VDFKSCAIEKTGHPAEGRRRCGNAHAILIASQVARDRVDLPRREGRKAVGVKIRGDDRRPAIGKM
jgi:hypothetical protein